METADPLIQASIHPYVMSEGLLPVTARLELMVCTATERRQAVSVALTVMVGHIREVVVL